MKRITVLLILIMSIGIAQVPEGTLITNVAECTYQDPGDFSYTTWSDTVETVVEGSIDLVIDKNVSQVSILPGDTLIYTLSISNLGNTTVEEITVIDTLPGEFQYIASAPEGSISGQTVSWTIPIIQISETLEFQIQVMIDENVSHGYELVNSAWMHINSHSPVESNRVTVLVDQYPAVIITKTVDKQEAIPGDTLMYAIVYSNTGNMSLTDVVIVDFLPEGVIFDFSNPNGIYYSATHSISWSLDTLDQYEEGIVSLSVIVEDTVNAYSILENEALIQSAQGAGDLSSASTFIMAAPILTVEKHVKGVAVAGDTLAYNITYSNVGITSAKQVTLIDTLSADLEFISAEGLYFYNQLDHSISWELGDLAVGQEDGLTITTQIHAPLDNGTIIPNSILINCFEGVSDWSETQTVVKSPEFILEISGDTTEAVGNSVEYIITYSNIGDTLATNTVITDTLPKGVTFVSASGNGIYLESIHGIQWDIGILDENEQGNYSFVVIIDDTTNPSSILLDKAEINCDQGAHAYDEYEIYILPAPEIYINKVAAESVLAGDTLTYTIHYANNGTTTATEVTIVDTLNSFLEFIEATGTNIYDPESHSVSWDIGTLFYEEADSVSLSALVKLNIAGKSAIHNLASISCREGVRVTSEAITIAKAPKLVLDKTADSTHVTSGDTLTYTFTVSNIGDTTAFAVTLLDSLPEKVIYISSTNSSEYDPINHVVIWNLGDIDVSEDNGSESPETLYEELMVLVESPISDGFLITNQATVQSSDGLIDTAEVTITVISKPLLRVDKLGATEVFPGDSIVYSIHYENIGTDLATNVVLRDTLPSEVTFISATGSHTYNANNHSIEWIIGDVIPGESGDYSLSAIVTHGLDMGAQFTNHVWGTFIEGLPVHDELTTTNILPLSIELIPNPRIILGNGEAASILNAFVYTFIGNPVPDGIPVVFSSDIGTIPDLNDTTLTSNGIAQSILISDIVVAEPVDALVNAKAIYTETTSVEDTTIVTFAIGAFEGWVINYEGYPIEDALVELLRISTSEIVRTDSTDSDGYYLIPVSSVDDYEIQYTYDDDNGNEVVTTQDVEFDVPTNGDVVTNLNSVSGWLYDESTGLAINEAGITIILWFIPDSTNDGNGRFFADAISDTIITDSTGMYFFTNLDAGNYFLEAIYNGTQSYSNGAIELNLTVPGTYVVAANIVLRQSPFYMYKTVDKDEAATGDTLNYTIFYGSQDVASIDTIRVVDLLPAGIILLESSIVHSNAIRIDKYESLTNEIHFSRHGLTLYERDSIRFKAVVGNSSELFGATQVENISLVTNDADTASSIHDSRTNAITKIIYPFLHISKTVNRRVAEIGDVLTYTVTLENKSTNEYLKNIQIVDLLPKGFRQKTKKVYWDSKRISKPSISEGPNSRMQMVWLINDTLDPGEIKELKYRTIVGISVKNGENINDATAVASTMGDYPVTSDNATATVIINPGLFSDRGLIFGKVYYDLNGNDIHDQSEPGVKGVELITETGARVVTDEFGKYSIPNIPSGNHVLRVNEHSITPNHEIVVNSIDYLGDNTSRLVHVSPGGIAKSNFSVQIIPSANKFVKPDDGLEIALSAMSIISMKEEAFSDGIRVMQYQPWSMQLRMGFLSGESSLRPEIYTAMRKVAEFLLWQPHIDLSVEGHTDNIDPPGSSPFVDNLGLSIDRANNIKLFLVDEMGIDADRIHVRGFGSSQPLVSNETREGRKENRRVDLVFSTSHHDQPVLNTIQLTFDINTKGGVPYDDVEFHENLPSGFIYAANTARLNGKAIQPESVSDVDVIWNIGYLSENEQSKLTFNIVPNDFEAITGFNISKAHLVFENPNGRIEQSEDLITNVIALVEELSFKLSLDGTHFDVNSATLKGSSFEPIERLGKFMTWQPAIKVVIDGFTDSDGDKDYNIQLSSNRAESVKNYLTENFYIDGNRISTRGFGHRYPIGNNDNILGKQENRRVEVLVNSEIGSELVMGIEVIKDSVGQIIHSTKTYLVNDDSGQSIKVPAEGPVSFNMYLDFENVIPVDMLELTIQMPNYIKLITEYEKLLIDEKRWFIPVTPEQKMVKIELNAYIDPAFNNDIIKVRTRMLKDNEVIHGNTNRHIRMNTNKTYAENK